MNTQYFLYAIEVEKTGSITQAASNLFMTQPTLSKAIKDLEASVGFRVFKRTSKGVVPTQQGIEFLNHAKKIAIQLQKMEAALHAKASAHQLFSLAIPRVSYIAKAASEFISTFDNHRDMEIDILETSSMRVMDSIADGHIVLGVIRYRMEDEDYYLKYLAERGLQYETIWQSDYAALMRSDHPLAQQHLLSAQDFQPYIEVTFGDAEVPYIRVSEAETVSGIFANKKRILVYDRAMQFDMLRANPLAYMWVSPLPNEILRNNGLVQLKCSGSGQFKDLLISRSGHRFSNLDREFINKLFLQKNEVAYGG